MSKIKQITILAVIIGVLAGVGFWVISLNQSEPEVTEEVFIETSPEPTEEPEPEFEKSDYSILVLNGGGIAGAAGDMQDFLVDLGYDVVDTGNADSYDYVKTVVQAKEGVPQAFIDALVDELGEEYDVDDVETLDDDADEDVVVIVGSNGEEVDDSDEDEASDDPTPEDTDDEDTDEEASDEASTDQ